MVTIDESATEQVKIKREFDHTIKLADNAMLKHRPDLFDEWDFEKNDELGLNVYKVTKGSSQKVHWIGLCGHKWEAIISNRAKGYKCAYCTNKKVLIGFNDMWTTNPELALLLLNPSDGYKYTHKSNQRVDWKCNSCQNNLLNKIVSNVNRCGLACQYCSDGKSFPERFIYRLLNSLNLTFEWDRGREWSEDRRYDFYIPKQGNIIIEVHGSQHYKKSFSTAGGRTLEEEVTNDIYKKELAIKNGVQHYITIDARGATFDFIKKSVLESSLPDLFDLSNVDWIALHRKIVSPIIKEVVDLWNEGYGTAGDIGLKLNLDRNAVTNYLKVGATFGVCDYTPKKGKKLSDGKAKKPVVQLTLEGELVKHWNSATDYIEEFNKKSIKGIRNCCLGKIFSCYGYQWKDEADYEEILRGENPSEKLKYVKSTNKKIVQLDTHNNLIKEWASMSDAANELGGNVSNISSCCRGGTNKTAMGFKWMYKENYFKEVK